MIHRRKYHESRLSDCVPNVVKRRLAILGIVGLLSAPLYLINSGDATPFEWQPYSDELLEKMLRDDKLVVVSVMANWDILSKFHEFPFQSARVRRLVNSRDVVCLRVDITKYEDANDLKYIEIEKKWRRTFDDTIPLGIAVFPRKVSGHVSPIVFKVDEVNEQRIADAILVQNGEGWKSILYR